ncbi:MAG TPA: hypothetical protein VG125_27775, partial [Pirellulales bacterium]|nr:hypothetical protein [Pirellulales bacterium]
MVSHQLVEQWRVRLAAWQQRLDEGRPRPWLARAYVRVLSYLLSQYTAQADSEPPLETIETAQPLDADLTPARSAMKLQVAAPDLSGKAPRTATTIRSVLETVQENVPQAQQGPLIGGLRPDDPIMVTAFYSLVEISRLLRMLEAEGIGWQTLCSGRKV